MTTRFQRFILRVTFLLGSFALGSTHAQFVASTVEAVSSSVDSLPNAPSSMFSQQATAAQADLSAPIVETPAQRKARLYEEAERQLKQQKSQRMLGVLPNFNTVLNGKAVPLTAGQKWDLAVHSSTDPFNFAAAFVIAGFDETDDGHQGYHWGPKGYFKRVGASYADSVNGTLVGNALLPILLHQDPRYFRKGTGPIKARLLYAALSTVVCKGDNGKTQFNVSNVAGNFVSGAISNLYYPSDESGLELTLTNASVVTAEGALGALLLEFGPDLQKHLLRKKTYSARK